MVIDTSALLAILQDEPERRRFNEAIEEADHARVSAVTLVEASMVLEVRFGLEAVRELDAFVDRAGIVIDDVDAAQARQARLAFGRYGKGRHRAGLNFGDCFAYALAAVRGEALLFKGDDFAHTDIRSAL